MCYFYLCLSIICLASFSKTLMSILLNLRYCCPWLIVQDPQKWECGFHDFSSALVGSSFSWKKLLRDIVITGNHLNFLCCWQLMLIFIRCLLICSKFSCTSSSFLSSIMIISLLSSNISTASNLQLLLLYFTFLHYLIASTAIMLNNKRFSTHPYLRTNLLENGSSFRY